MDSGAYILSGQNQGAQKAEHSRTQSPGLLGEATNLSEVLKDSFAHGDYSMISKIYNERNRGAKKQVSPPYVRNILLDDSDTYKSLVAAEVREIAEQYFTIKGEYVRMLIET